jgi:hypothetical protein
MAQAGFDVEYANQTQKLDGWPRSKQTSYAGSELGRCADGEWWDPTGKVCRPLGVGPQPLACEPGQWWDPTANVCRPLGVGPQPLACDNGWWWDPAANVCRPPLVAPPG